MAVAAPSLPCPDANVVLGYLPPVLLGGDMTLDVEAAREAVARVGTQIGLSPKMPPRASSISPTK